LLGQQAREYLGAREELRRDVLDPPRAIGLSVRWGFHIDKLYQ
jgi:hypothetical protein